MMKKSTIRPLILALFLFSTPTVNALDYVYKRITLDIPSCEITGGGIVNIPPYETLFFSGKNWDMGFDDSRFMKTCLLLSEKLGNTIFSCEEKNRIQMLDNVIKDESLAAQIFFSSQPNAKIKRQEFKDYVLYSSAESGKYSIAILVEKQTGKTTEIKGKFTDEQLKWLRLAPL